MTRRKAGWVAAWAAVAVALTGCENGPPAGAPVGTASPVRGKITLADGTPVKGGLATFTPVERETRGGKLRYTGGALISAAGEYKAGFNGDGAGLVPGEYKVSVGPREVGEVPGSNAGRVPRLLQAPETTTVKITVEEKENQLNITLK